MTAVTSRRTRHTHVRERTPGGALSGTGALLRLFLRISRRQIIIWTLAFLVLVPASVAAMEEAYPDAEALAARASLLNNPAAVMMTGPAFALEDYTFGAMVANELALYIFIAAAIMSVLLMVRHTRAEEESGRLEMLRALPVGRFAAAVAALATVAIANLAVGVVVTAGLLATGGAAPDSIAFGLATALTGLVFGALAAVTSQITEHARTASGLALGAIAVAFIVRGIGDVIDRQGSWLSWFSPIAWAQQTRLFVDLRWWPLAVSAAAVAVLLLVAIAVAQRRDLGAGLRSARPGPEVASRALLVPGGLAGRLVTGTMLVWAIGLFLFALAFGMLASSLEEMVADIPAVGEWIALDLDDLTESFAAVMLSMLALGPVGLIVSGVLQLRGEEQDGRLGGLVISGGTRVGLLGGWLTMVAVQVLLVQVVLGLGLGIGIAVATEESSWIGQMTLASLAYLPAILLCGAFTAALYGLVPRLASLAWALVVWAAIVVFLGELLDLPDWARGVSPLHHTPLVPEAALEATPLLVMGGLAAVLIAAGVVGVRRRDIVAG